MYRNRLTQLVRCHLFSGQGINVIISLVLASVVLLIIIPKQNYQVSRDFLISDVREFKHILNFIAPAQLGVDQWRVGDYAQYQYHKYRSHSLTSTGAIGETGDPSGFSDDSNRVSFHIIDKLKTPESHKYWMKIRGMLFFRNIAGDIYQLESPNDRRITTENRRYEFLDNYIPSKVEHYDFGDTPLAKLVELGQVEIKTEAGRFECTHYRVELGSTIPTIEIWANPKIRPLGIVRAQSQDEVLELISFGPKPDIAVPKLMQPVIQGVSILNHGCTSCHGADSCHESIFPPK